MEIVEYLERNSWAKCREEVDKRSKEKNEKLYR